MDNEKNQGGVKSSERREDGGDGANRARNRTVMLTPEVTGQVRALLNQDRPSDSSMRDSTAASDGFAPVGSFNPMTGLIGREPQRSASGSFGNIPEPRPATPTGAPLEPSVIQSARQQSVGVVSDKLTKLIGFLVSYDNNSTGEVLDLRHGRWIVSSERTSDGNFLIVKDETISPLHAIVKISEAGEIQVLDQLSEHGTTIRKSDGTEEKLSGSMGAVCHGDTVSFGGRNFHVCLIPV